jgi:nucleoside 2-deoxyribosyltransferase
MITDIKPKQSITEFTERLITMQKSQSKLYVGCSLTQASESFKKEVEDFKSSLREQGHEVFDFVGLVNGTSADVYKWDIGHCVRDCDLLVAVCDLPSIGLGWELGEATRLGKPVLALAHEDAKVTRLVLGAAEVEPNVRFERYAKLADMVATVNELLSGKSV